MWTILKNPATWKLNPTSYYRQSYTYQNEYGDYAGEDFASLHDLKKAEGAGMLRLTEIQQ